MSRVRKHKVKLYWCIHGCGKRVEWLYQEFQEIGNKNNTFKGAFVCSTCKKIVAKSKKELLELLR